MSHVITNLYLMQNNYNFQNGNFLGRRMAFIFFRNLFNGRFSYLILCSIYCDMLLELKYVKKI